MKLVWLRRALADRDAQLDFIAEDNPQAAIEQGDRLDEAVVHLAEHPNIGRPGRVRTTREWVIARTPFIVVYRLKGERIELLRVLHGAQQWPKRG